MKYQTNPRMALWHEHLKACQLGCQSQRRCNVGDGLWTAMSTAEINDGYRQVVVIAPKLKLGDTCPKCNQVVKERFLLNDTFVGCLC